MSLLKILYIRFLFGLHKPISDWAFLWNAGLWIATGLCIIFFTLSPWFLLVPILLSA